MNTSDKSKRKFEKFLNINNSREKNRNKDNKLNISNVSKDNSYNNTEKRKYQYEFSNSKRNDINLNLIKNNSN